MCILIAGVCKTDSRALGDGRIFSQAADCTAFWNAAPDCCPLCIHDTQNSLKLKHTDCKHEPAPVRPPGACGVSEEARPSAVDVGREMAGTDLSGIQFDCHNVVPDSDRGNRHSTALRSAGS